jgi:23S rRNA pseudouridine955/2504/2580 synthase
VRKLYWAAVAGVPAPPAGEIDLPLAKRGGSGGERVAPDTAGGTPARTRYRVVERAGRAAAWLEMEPLTGRTHQLRAHCAAIGTPIIGDGKYGGRAALLATAGIGTRMQLHARALVVAHPAHGTLALAAGLPPHMRDVWTFFGFDEEAVARTLQRWPDAGELER